MESAEREVSEVILISFGNGFLALSRNEFMRALDLGQQIIGRPEIESTINEAERILDADQASEITGIPASWFQEAARKGRIPCIRAGKYVRFRMSNLFHALEVRSQHMGRSSLEREKHNK